jgi:5-(carboxyamino)imidazole ribonucleotide synthase
LVETESDEPLATLGRAAELRRLAPGAAIGILGGGQLGRMLGIAARAMGYRIAVLDPDPACPAAAIADRVVVGGYDDASAALELAGLVDVVTYELEHVDAGVVEALEARIPVRPGLLALRVAQDRLAERRFLAGLGLVTAPWREASDASLLASARTLGFPLRIKAPFGGYDGRSQVRVSDEGGLSGALQRLGRPAGSPVLVEAELDYAMELSVIVARGLDGELAAYPVGRNRHDSGILVESVVPADVPAEVGAAAAELGAQVAEALAAVGVVSVELFLLRDGSLAVNEIAPRVHNSGHWTIEGAHTSQFEQHVRAICGLPLGDPAALGPTAMVNLLGSGDAREAHLAGVAEALADPLAHLHVYAKRTVFERRKMGHLTVAGAATPGEALARARAAAAHLRWT